MSFSLSFSSLFPTSDKSMVSSSTRRYFEKSDLSWKEESSIVTMRVLFVLISSEYRNGVMKFFPSFYLLSYSFEEKKCEENTSFKLFIVRLLTPLNHLKRGVTDLCHSILFHRKRDELKYTSSNQS